MITRNWLLWSRMGSVRQLLISVLASTLIAASLIAALAGFAAGALPRAISVELARSPPTSVFIYGAFGAQQARIDRPKVGAALRRAFGSVPYTTDEAVWSDPIALPVRGRGKTVSLLEAAALTGMRARVRLTAGTWPGRSARGGPVRAVAPASVARDLQMKLGRAVNLRDRQSGARVRFLLTGLYRPVDPRAPYWAIDLIAQSGVSVQAGFNTYGPLLVGPGDFSSGAIATDGVTWLVSPAVKAISAASLKPLAYRVGLALAYLAGSPDLGGLQVSSSLPAAFSGVTSRLVVARSLLLVAELELLLLAGATLTLTARTLASHREDEAALLAARGAGRWQLARLALAEALLLAAAGTAAGLLLGGLLARQLAKLGQLREAGLRIIGTPAQVWWTLGAVLVLCTAIMLWPAVHAASPIAARARKGRRTAVSAAARAGGDVALVLLASIAVWQLRHYSLLGRTAGGLGVDPVLAVAPAIALAAATVLPLRVLPALAAAADRLAARTRRLGVAMTSWQLSRCATRQSAPMLLVVFAVGAGTLALAQHQSWRQSALDQSAFAAGADVRADLAAPLPLGRAAAFYRVRGVRAAMAVSTSLVTDSNAQVLALDASRATRTVLLRRDQSAAPPAALWRQLTPAAAARSVALPGRPSRLEIIASLDKGPGADLGPVDVSVSVQDGAGIVYLVPAGVLPDDGREHPLIADLSAMRQAIYPLRVLAITAGYTLPPVPGRGRAAAAGARQSVFAVHGFAVSSSRAGHFAAPFGTGQLLAGWKAAASAPTLAVAGVGVQPRLLVRPGAAPAGSVSFSTGYGQTSQFAPPLAPPIYSVSAQLAMVAPPPPTIPAIATAAFLAGSHLRVGDRYQFIAPGPATITVRIVSSVATFPTITSRAGGLIIDQGAAQQVFAAQSAPPLTVTQWWLSAHGGAVPGGLPAGSAVTDRSKLAAGLLTDPMSVIAQQAVQSIAVAAALLAILGFSVSLAGSVRERRSQAALLSALGVSQAAQVRLLCTEALALSAPAAVTGLLLGIVLAHVLLPAVLLTATAAAPVPPALVHVPLTTTAMLAAAVMAIPVAAAAVAAMRQPDASGQLRAAEAT